MRIIPLILITSLLFYNQSGKIIGSQKICDSNETCWIRTDISVKKNGQKINKKVYFKEEKFYIKNLKKGTYTLTYFNIFNQEVSQIIELSKRKFKIEICLDKFLNTESQTEIESMKNGDKFLIQYYESGCHHNREDEILIEQLDGKLYTTLVYPNKIRIEISNFHQNYLINFEKELQAIENTPFDCTTQSLYTIWKNGKKISQYEDSSCLWNGFEKLKDFLLNMKTIN